MVLSRVPYATQNIYNGNVFSHKNNAIMPLVEHTIFIKVLDLAKIKIRAPGCLGGSVVKNPPPNAGDTGSISGSGRSHMLQRN